MRFIVLTLFPEMFPGPLGYSLAGKALQKNLWQLEVITIRDFASDKHQTVDAPGFGGGPGLVMQADVLDHALSVATHGLKNPGFFYFSPRGKPMVQADLHIWSQTMDEMVLLCGRYEGVDQRLLDHWSFQEISLGDFVLAGGEIPAYALMEGCVRLLPGTLKQPETLQQESFESGLLEYPHYTRPQIWKGRSVPDILLSGNHAEIASWRRQQTEVITQERRPDLWEKYQQRQKDNIKK